MTYYGSKLSNNIVQSPEGYLICMNVPIARTGDQEYYADEIGLEEDYNNSDSWGKKVITIHREPDEVFSKATLASFEGKPFTDEHPDEDLNPTNYNSYAKGHIQNVRRGQGEDEDKIIADIYVNDPKTINEIQNGKREISCGYLCCYHDNEDGTFNQVNIRGNHISLVNEGRAGSSVCIKDSKNSERRKTKMGNTKQKSALNSFLNVFARSVRDAKNPDEVDEMVENAEETVKNLPDGNVKEEVKEVPVVTKDNPNGMEAPTNEVNNSLLSAILALTEAIQNIKAEPKAVIPEPQIETDAVEEEKKEKVLNANTDIEDENKIEEDDSMVKLDKIVKDEDQVNKNDNETAKLAEYSLVEKGNAPDGGKEDFDAIKTKDEDEVEKVDKEEDVVVEDGCDEDGNEDAVTKIVKDMKPVLSQIKDYKTRKLVCDSLARTLNKNRGSNSIKNILDNSASFVKDSNYHDYSENVYDKYNPHIKNNK